MSCRGQSTVEAAVLLPTLMLLFALLVQPICVLYTRTIMAHVASELARVALTERDEQQVRSYALRRLEAVPEASLFHVGGQADWELSSQCTSDGTVCVEISGHLRPLPFFGVATWLLGERDGADLLLRVRVEETLRPTWLEGDYDEWVQVW
ncbi:MAG: pilus assembly protein [Coriobacteriales bacterium]|nr:pilus assembly protein [Coriobacteriales bacterium]